MKRTRKRRKRFLGLLDLRKGLRYTAPAWVQHAWLSLLPLLFLPNLGFEVWTPFGMVELADLLMPVFLALVWMGSTGRRMRLLSLAPTKALVAFLAFCFLAILLFPMRAGYSGDDEMVFSALKVAKFLLYAAAGSLTAASWSPNRAVAFRWSMMAAALVAALAILLMPEEVERPYEYGEAIRGFKAANTTSVMLAMLFVYLVAGPPAPGRLVAGIWYASLALVFTGWLCSHGRGGWVAGACGFVYLSVFGRRAVRTALLMLAIALAVYNFSPDFQQDFAKTFVDGAGYGSRIGVVDDGNRTTLWRIEGSKFWDAPLLGQGFFHRYGASSLNWWGCHNFWLQMLLETGLLGGTLLTLWLVHLWRSGSWQVPRLERLAGRSALIAGLVGGLGGDYLYGGTTLLAFFLVLAPTLGCAMDVEHAKPAEKPVGVSA